MQTITILKGKKVKKAVVKNGRLTIFFEDGTTLIAATTIEKGFGETLCMCRSVYLKTPEKEPIKLIKLR